MEDRKLAASFHGGGVGGGGTSAGHSLPDQQHIVFSVDIEHFGPVNRTKSFAIVATKQPDDVLLEKFQVNIDTTTSWRGMTASEYWQNNPSCYDVVMEGIASESLRALFFSQCGFDFYTLKHFWVKKPELLESLCKNAMPFAKATERLKDIWKYLVEKYAVDHETGKRNTLVIVSDNPVSDIGRLNEMVSKHTAPLQHISPNVALFVHDIRMMVKGYMKSWEAHDVGFHKFTAHARSLGFHIQKPHTHDPIDDARFAARIYGLYIRCCRRDMMLSHLSDRPAVAMSVPLASETTLFHPQHCRQLPSVMSAAAQHVQHAPAQSMTATPARSTGQLFAFRKEATEFASGK